MKKYIIILAVVLTVSVAANIILALTYKHDTLLVKDSIVPETDGLDIFEDDYKNRVKENLNKYNPLQGGGYISNASIAINYAKLVIREIFGEEALKESEPYKAFFFEEDQVWHINGYLPPNMLGGTPNVIISKLDGKILAVWQSR